MTAPPSIAEGTGSPPAIRPLPAPADGPPPAVAEEYDFLWGATQARSVADAAIRAPDADGARPPAFPASGPFNGMSAGTGMAMSAQPSLPPVASSPPPAAGGLIDAMPWGPGPAAPDETDETGFTVKRGNLPRAGHLGGTAPGQDRPGGPGADLPGRAREPAERGALPQVRRGAAAGSRGRATAGARRAPAIGRRHDLA